MHGIFASWRATALYLLAFVICAFIRVEQPGFTLAVAPEKTPIGVI